MAKLIEGSYGDALFELALEQNNLDSIAEQVDVLAQSFAENPELTKLLSHPKISKEEKIRVVENIFKGRFSDDIVGFLVIITQKDRGAEIENILYHIDETTDTPCTVEQIQDLVEDFLMRSERRDVAKAYTVASPRFIIPSAAAANGEDF